MRSVGWTRLGRLRVDPDDARGVLLGHLVRQFHEPPEVVVERLLAARRIDGGHDLVGLPSARTISASLVAIPIAMLITVRPRLLVIRRARPNRHLTLALQLSPPVPRMPRRGRAKRQIGREGSGRGGMRSLQSRAPPNGTSGMAYGS